MPSWHLSLCHLLNAGRLCSRKPQCHQRHGTSQYRLPYQCVSLVTYHVQAQLQPIVTVTVFVPTDPTQTTGQTINPVSAISFIQASSSAVASIGAS